MEELGSIAETLKGYGGYSTTIVLVISFALTWWKGLPVVIAAIGGRDSQLRDHYDREILSLEKRMGEMQVQADKRYAECQRENDTLRREAREREEALVRVIDDLRNQMRAMQRGVLQAEVSAVRENMDVPPHIKDMAERASRAIEGHANNE